MNLQLDEKLWKVFKLNSRQISSIIFMWIQKIIVWSFQIVLNQLENKSNQGLWNGGLVWEG